MAIVEQQQGQLLLLGRRRLQGLWRAWASCVLGVGTHPLS
jgi:hypothetical protein